MYLYHIRIFLRIKKDYFIYMDILTKLRNRMQRDVLYILVSKVCKFTLYTNKQTYYHEPGKLGNLECASKVGKESQV